jgi:hypothetical protein
MRGTTVEIVPALVLKPKVRVVGGRTASQLHNFTTAVEWKKVEDG